MPLGAVLAFAADLGVRGLWSGLVSAMLLIIIGQYTYLYRTLDWEAAAQRARERAQRDATGAEESEGRGLAVADSARAAANQANEQHEI